MDWADGMAVLIALPLAGHNSAALYAAIDGLGERGWLTPSGTWRIHQRGVTWNGFGAASLVEALRHPDERYLGRRMHHSETVTYFDGSGNGVQYGTSVASAGDTNGDGRADVVVGAPLCTDSVVTQGCAWLYAGQTP